MENIVNEGGRPSTIIDWDLIDPYLIKGCTGQEVAGLLGVHPNTIYQRCILEKGMSFTEYLQRKRSKGYLQLRSHQYDKAMGITDKGDTALLIWLGKASLAQTDKIVVVTETDKNIEEAIDDADGKSKELVDDHIQD